MVFKIHDKEIVLQHLWKSRWKFENDLQTVSGKNVEILYAGSENQDAGPDFKEALVKINGALIKGDIEVHLKASGWYEHNHHRDPAYNRVVLHVVSELSSEEPLIQREDGVGVEQVVFKLDAQALSAFEKLREKSNFESNVISVVQNCPLSKEGNEKILSVVKAAGEQRFLDKVAQLHESLLNATWDQLLYKKIMEALGYSKNQAPFRKLAELVTFDAAVSEMQWVDERSAEIRCAALLFGASGLLPLSRSERVSFKEESLDYIMSLTRHWQAMSRRLAIRPMKSHEWQFFRLRPQNFPTRRLAGLIAILSRNFRSGFLRTFTGILSHQNRNLKSIPSELEKILQQPARGFWRQHFRFEETTRPRSNNKAHFLIGKERARDIIVNVVLPVLYLYSKETSAGRLKNIIWELYRHYPRLSENVITRKMFSQLNRHGGQYEAKLAHQQQGLIHLNKLYCRKLRCASCLKLDNKS